MSDTEFSYMGKQITIKQEHPHAVVTVDGREFHCHHHHPEEHAPGLPMWMCDEAYFASPDLKQLARHFADYGYMFDAPGRIVVNDAGEVVDHTKTRAIDAEPPVREDLEGERGTHDHEHGGGN